MFLNYQDAEDFAGTLERFLFGTDLTPLQQPGDDFSNLLLSTIIVIPPKTLWTPHMQLINVHTKRGAFSAMAIQKIKTCLVFR